jgi:polyhydroxyalkanoate synthesis regulator phasin
MALKLPKFLTGTNARSRIVILFAGVAGFFLLVYFIVFYVSGGSRSETGASKIANAPPGLKSVPGSQLSPEYYRALTQANTQAAEQAQITGSSAVPTLINVPTPTVSGSSENCTVLCPSEDKVTVADDINELLKSGKISQAVANQLLDLAKRNVSVDEYAAALDELVRQGKLTPEQARALLEKYKKQHANALASESAKVMDGLIKAGKLSLTTANELLELQKKGLTPAEYAAELQRLVKEGKISQEMADQLMAQYAKQHEQEAAKKAAFAMDQMVKSGQITADVAKRLADLQNKNVPLDQYAAELDRLVKEGKMTPEAAAKLLAMYKAVREAGGPPPCLEPLRAKGGEFAAEWDRLNNLRSNNATLTQYTDELKRGVQSGLVTPDMAACALQHYQAVLTAAAQAKEGAAATVPANIAGAKEFAALQQRVQQAQQSQQQLSQAKQAELAKQALSAGQQPPGANPAETQQFLAAQMKAQAEEDQARRDRIQALQAAMATQAQSLVTAWQPPTMVHVGAAPEDKTKGIGTGTETGKGAKAGTSKEEENGPPKPSLIKAGAIMFAVLDTAVDSDYPDTPVMATIVQGPFKGAKVIGKLSLAQGKDRVSLNFTTMDKEDWPEVKNISAFAIDPDTAHTVLASSVDYHYLKRYGAMMGAAFVQGYASAITQAGSTSTTIAGGGFSSSHPELSPTDKIAVGIGQVGTTMGQAISSYINTPVTVKVNSGVGIGILFTAPVTE